MPPKRSKDITPSQVAMQLDWDIGAITDFCANVLEDANDHNVSLALRALNAEDYELAKEFIDLEAAHAEAGELTTELSQKRDELMGRLEEAEGAVDESEEDPRDRSARR
jgi:hypothetical protein